jgi:hypothetical protein
MYRIQLKAYEQRDKESIIIFQKQILKTFSIKDSAAKSHDETHNILLNPVLSN